MKSDIDVSESFWSHFFTFIRPSIQFDINRETLEAIPERIEMLVNLIHESDEPKAFLDFGPYVKEQSARLHSSKVALIAASALIAHRYERIRLIRDLLSSWSHSILQNQLTAAALLSRMMTELAADISRDHAKLRKYIKKLSIAEFINECSDFESELFSHLYKMRYAGRIIDYDDADLIQPNVLGALDKLPTWVQASYRELSEICHPNSQATAIYWKIGNEAKGELSPVEYIQDLSDSASPFKIQIAVGPYALSGTCPNFADFFWGLAQCLSGHLQHVKTQDREVVGLPYSPGRNEDCFCKSGVKFKNCAHPSFFRN